MRRIGFPQICLARFQRRLGSAVAQTILRGRTVGHNAGTTADFVVDNVNGSDSNAGTALAPFATVAHAFAQSTGGGKTIALRDSGQPYLESFSSSLNNITVKGYGAEQPRWYGSLKVIGFAQCTVADAGFLGSVDPTKVYKATIAKSALAHTAYHALLPLENGSPLNLAQVRHDTTDLFFQDNSNAFFQASAPYSDSVVIATASRNVVQVNKKGAANGSDALFVNAPVTSIVAVNQGGTWNGTSFVGGTTYTATTDYTLSGNSISWAPAGAEPATGSNYTVVFAATVIDTITHAAALGNGTTPYTDTQLAKCGVMIRCSPNESVFFNVTGSSGGVLTVETLDQIKDGAPTGDCYSLLNIAPALVQGQYVYDASDPTNLTIYYYPNNAADVASGILVAAKNNVLTFSQCSNPRLENIEFGHTSNDGTGQAAVVLDRVTASVSTPVIAQCTIQYVSHRQKGYGGVLVTGGSGCTLQYNDFKNAQNQFGPFILGSPNAATNHRLLNCYMYRIAQSPWRVYATTLVAVGDIKAESCGVSAHANKGNFYQGCDQYVAYRLWYISCGGYLTCQQASRGYYLLNLCPADPSSTDARAFDDQTGSIQPPTDPSSNFQFNNAYSVPEGNTGTGNSLSLTPDSGLWTVKWKVRNCIAKGLDTNAGHLVDTPDFNVLTKGSGIGANDSVVTDPNTIFYDYSAENWNTVPGSILTSKAGTDVSADVAVLESWFPDINFRLTLNGYPWDPADPGIGPYGKYWPVQADTVAPTLSSLAATITGASAACSVTTNERSGTIYWVRYHTGAIPSAAQVVAGQDATGASALSSGSVAVKDPGAYNFTVTGTNSVTDTLALVHKDRNGNISAVSTTSLPFAAYSPTWWSNDGTHKLHTAGLTGAQASTKSMLAAFTVSRTSTQLTTATSGGVLTGTVSTNIPTWGMSSASKMQISQKDVSNVALGTITSPSVVMTAGTQYLFLLAFTSSAGGGYKFQVVCINIATGAVVGTNQQLTGTDDSLTYNMAMDALKAAASYERLMLWDNVYADPTLAATQQMFVGASGGLIDPVVAVNALGAAIVNIPSGALTTGANAGYGGNFTFS